jgi:hypothetical protein
VADGGGRVPVAAEVAAFEGEVGGDEELVAGGWFEDGAVVADAEANGAGGGGAGADAVDEAQLAERFFCAARVGRVRHRFQSKWPGWRVVVKANMAGGRLLRQAESVKMKGRSSGNCAELSQGLQTDADQKKPQENG